MLRGCTHAQAGTRCAHQDHQATKGRHVAFQAPLGQRAHMHRRVVAHNKFNDDLLDFVTAGPKLRKWYGAGERLPNDGGGEDGGPGPDPEEEVGLADAVLVTDAESDLGEQCVLQLILARAALKLLVSDTAAAKTAYGPYVQPVSTDISNQAVLAKALKGIKCLVLLGQLGKLLEAAKAAKVQHVVLVSAGSNGSGGGFNFFGRTSTAGLQDPKREEAVQQCGIPYTIVRVGGLTEARGGQPLLVTRATQQQPTGSKSVAGSVGQEDLAALLALLPEMPPAAGTAGRTLEVSSSVPGAQREWQQAVRGMLAAAATA